MRNTGLCPVILLVAADDSSGVAMASAWLEAGSRPRELSVVPVGQGRYRIDLGAVGFSSREGTISIRSDDAAGNALEMGMLIPLRRRQMHEPNALD